MDMEEVTSKVCRQCNELKPLADYYNRSDNKIDGKQYICKECMAVNRREKAEIGRKKKDEEKLALGDNKYCSTCGELKPFTEYYKSNGTKDGLMPRCKSCHSNYQSNYHKNKRANKRAEIDQQRKLDIAAYGEPIEGVNARYCSKCGELKVFLFFSPQKGSLYGYTSECSDCKKKAREELTELRKEGVFESRKDKKYKEAFFNRRIEGDLEEYVNAKVCRICGELKPYEYYNTRERAKDGYDGRCKECFAEYVRNLNSKNSYERLQPDLSVDGLVDGKNAKVCGKCGVLKHYDDYGSHKDRKDGMQFWCKECKNEHSRKHQKENRARYTAYASKRRAIQKEAVPEWLTDDDFEFIDSLYEGASRLSEETGIEHHVDHIYPLQPKNGPGGVHEPSNLMVMIGVENMDKKNKIHPPPEGMEYINVICNGVEKITTRLIKE